MTTATITITDGTAWFEDGTTVHCTVQQIKALPLLLNALDLANKAVGKGIAEHAYDGCVVSGERMLGFIVGAIEASGWQPLR